jgi:hypothetical protein
MAAMSPLRRRMIEDMTIRNLTPGTQRSYVQAVARFSRYFGRSPDRLGPEDVRAYQVHLISRGIAWSSLNREVYVWSRGTAQVRRGVSGRPHINRIGLNRLPGPRRLWGLGR